MITKEEFIQVLRKSGQNFSGHEPEFANFEELVSIAMVVRGAMPGIGFCSAKGRMNCFLAVCRHLDSMVESGEIDLGVSQIILSIIRLKDRKFRKAIMMFDIRGSRYRDRERAELPRVAREYLAGLEMYG